MEDDARAHDPRAARSAALKMIAHRSRSRADLENRLRSKGFDAQAVMEALDGLRAAGLVDDTAHAQELAEHLFRRGWGPHVVRHRLRADGIDRDLAERVIAERLEATGEAELARRAAAGPISRLRDLSWEQRRARMYAYLARRGFSEHAILDALAGQVDD